MTPTLKAFFQPRIHEDLFEVLDGAEIEKMLVDDGEISRERLRVAFTVNEMLLRGVALDVVVKWFDEVDMRVLRGGE